MKKMSVDKIYTFGDAENGTSGQNFYCPHPLFVWLNLFYRIDYEILQYF